MGEGVEAWPKGAEGGDRTMNRRQANTVCGMGVGENKLKEIK
jgi:hypothetical protein